jgi:hypothetical protein
MDAAYAEAVEARTCIGSYRSGTTAVWLRVTPAYRRTTGAEPTSWRGVLARVRARARKGGMSLATFLSQKCHLRDWHPDSRAGSANLLGRRIAIPMRIWPKGGCKCLCLHPAEEGPAKEVMQTRRDGSPLMRWRTGRQAERPMSSGLTNISRSHRPRGAACLRRQALCTVCES